MMPYELNVVRRSEDALQVYDGNDLNSNHTVAYDDPAFVFLESILDNLGIASAKAQRLKTSITSMEKFLQMEDDFEQTLYILFENTADGGPFREPVGFLKVGWKQLLLLDHNQQMHEVKALCVLDFFVHETHRRSGNGKRLFDCMLTNERKKAYQVPIDNPSPMLRCFLLKHFGLTNGVPQLNKFVIFDGFEFPKNNDDSRISKFMSNSSGCSEELLRMHMNGLKRSDHRQPSSPSSWRVLGLEGPRLNIM